MTDQYGWKYFNELPDNFRPATEDDFKGERIYPGKPFLLLSYYSKQYECHRTYEHDTILGKIWPWLQDEHIFVLKTKK